MKKPLGRGCTLAHALVRIGSQCLALAACDRREQCQTLSETLARGSNLASDAKFGLIASYVVLIVIMMISFAACGLPGIFFGFPLAFAWIPASYLLLRDQGTESGPAAPA